MGLLYEGLTKDILASCFEVSNELGAGFTEDVYQNALAIVFADQAFKVVSQARLEVHFRGRVIGNFFADFLIDDKVILEIKAITGSLNIFQAQVINYLKASGLDVGLLVNFGRPRLAWYRLERPGIRNLILQKSVRIQE